MTSYFDVILKWIDIRRLRGIPWRFVIVMFSLPFLFVLYIWEYGNFPNWALLLYSMPLIIIIFVTEILPAIHRRPHDLFWFRSQTMLLIHHCPNCEYSLIGLTCGEDHLTTCPECGIAWLLPEEAKAPPSRTKQFLMRVLFTHHVMKIDSETKRDICPACYAFKGDNLTNSDSITTCPKCEASWKWPELMELSM